MISLMISLILWFINFGNYACSVLKTFLEKGVFLIHGIPSEPGKIINVSNFELHEHACMHCMHCHAWIYYHDICTSWLVALHPAVNHVHLQLIVVLIQI